MTAYVPGRRLVLGVIGGIELVTTTPFVDPTAGAGVVAPIGSVYFGISLYLKTGTGDTAWSPLLVGAPGTATPPGAATGAAINAAITAAAAVAVLTGTKQTVYLLAGTYFLETAIIGKSNVILRGVGKQTILIPTFTGAADDVANSVIAIDSAINTSLVNTTLTTRIIKDKSTAVVASIGSLVPGSYVLVQGRNVPAEDALLESDGTSVILSEPMRVLTAAVLTITSAWPWRQFHGTTGITVRGLTPVIAFEVWDLQIQGSVGGVTTANGIFGRYALDLELHGITISGCSRFAIDLVGCKNVRSSNFTSTGTNNGWLQCTSVLDSKFWDYHGTQGVARFHPLGIPRFPIFFRARCTAVTLDDVELVGVWCGGFLAGGEHIRTTNVRTTDVLVTQAAFDRFVAGGEIASAGTFPLGWGTGLGPLAYAEFAFDTTFDDMQAEGMRVPFDASWTGPPLKGVAYYWHDLLRAAISNISAINRGETADVTLVGGMLVSDVTGDFTNMSVQGLFYGWATANSANTYRVENFQYSGVPGNSPSASIPIYFNHGAGGHVIEMNDVIVSGGASGIRFGGAYVFDPNLTIRNYNNSGRRWGRVICGLNAGAAFATGAVAEIDPTIVTTTMGIRAVDTGAANYERRLTAIVSGTPDDLGTGFVMHAPFPQSIAYVNADATVVNYGASMVFVAPASVTTNNTLDGSPRLGMSLVYKAAGAAGIHITNVAG